jgi:tetratricopeptide (TPR) repeat protein
MKKILLLACVLMFLLVSSSWAEDDQCAGLLSKANNTVMLLSKRALLEKAVKQCPNNPEVNYQYAYCLERLRKYNEATTYYRKAVKLDKEKKTAKELFGLGDVCRMTGNLKEAVDAYEAGLRIEPSNKRAIASLAEVRAALAESASAKKEEKKERETAPPARKQEVPALKTAVPYRAVVDLRRMEVNLSRAGSRSMKLAGKAAADLKQKQEVDRQTWQ